MTFPVTFHVLGHVVSAHLVLELAGYTAGSQLYFYLRRRAGRSAALGGASAKLPIEQNLWLIVGCVFGALVGVPEGASLRVSGRFETNARFGEQFRIARYTEVAPATLYEAQRCLDSIANQWDAALERLRRYVED